jgi:hypothetical protein
MRRLFAALLAPLPIRSALILAVAALLPHAARAQDAKPVDLTGKWQFTVQSEAGSGTPLVTITQKGDSLTGRYSSSALGERDFKGTVKDGKFEFSFGAESGGMSFTMNFAGKVDGPDAISGAIDFSGYGEGTFSGKRIKQP